MSGILIFLIAAANAFAIDIQSPNCLTPKNNPSAPLCGIYLHGWFQPGVNTGYYADLQRKNLAQMQELANRQNCTIAAPLATDTNSRDMRTWVPSQNAHQRLAAIEQQSVSACGRPLGTRMQIFGFSDGGYMAREIGIACAAKSSRYSTVVMIGASAPVPGQRTYNRNREGCAKFQAVRGTEDGSTDTCLARNGKGNCIRSIPFATATGGMMDQLGGEILPDYSGGHILPPNTQLAGLMTPPANVATGPKPQEPPTVPTGVRPPIAQTPPKPLSPRRAEVDSGSDFSFTSK